MRVDRDRKSEWGLGVDRDGESGGLFLMPDAKQKLFAS